jgi:dTDP-4-dehydrorhamnose 3,5-epimerase
MPNFIFNRTGIDGVFIIETKRFGDNRGYFTETYQYDDFNKAGINAVFVQDNQSMSVKNTLRGMHFQKSKQQAKLVRVIQGEVFDAGVDLRPGSPTYGHWVGEILSDENHKQLFIPRGFAHGFLVLSETAVLAYKCDEFYYPQDEGGLHWNDPGIGIKWPLHGNQPILSEKDLSWGFLH